MTDQEKIDDIKVLLNNLCIYTQGIHGVGTEAANRPSCIIKAQAISEEIVKRYTDALESDPALAKITTFTSKCSDCEGEFEVDKERFYRINNLPVCLDKCECGGEYKVTSRNGN